MAKKLKMDNNLNESNFQIFAQKAIEKYMETGMMIDGILWGQIIKYYNNKIAELEAQKNETIRRRDYWKDLLEKLDAHAKELEEDVVSCINVLIVENKKLKGEKANLKHQLKQMVDNAFNGSASCKECFKKNQKRIGELETENKNLKDLGRKQEERFNKRMDELEASSLTKDDARGIISELDTEELMLQDEIPTCDYCIIAQIGRKSDTCDIHCKQISLVRTKRQFLIDIFSKKGVDLKKNYKKLLEEHSPARKTERS